MFGTIPMTTGFAAIPDQPLPALFDMGFAVALLLTILVGGALVLWRLASVSPSADDRPRRSGRGGLVHRVDFQSPRPRPGETPA